jgi:hypothetical protein
MRAFRFDTTGKLVPCEDHGPVFRELAPETDEEREERRRLLLHPVPVDRRQRRRFARHGTRGRRGVRRGPPPNPRAVAHRFASPAGSVLLYLPEGEQPTERHGRELDRAARAPAVTW